MIITNTVATSVKEGVFMCISLLGFITFLIITNQFLSLGMALWSRCGQNHIKILLCRLLVFPILLQHFYLSVLLQHFANIVYIETF